MFDQLSPDEIQWVTSRGTFSEKQIICTELQYKGTIRSLFDIWCFNCKSVLHATNYELLNTIPFYTRTNCNTKTLRKSKKITVVRNSTVFYNTPNASFT